MRETKTDRQPEATEDIVLFLFHILSLSPAHMQNMWNNKEPGSSLRDWSVKLKVWLKVFT